MYIYTYYIRERASLCTYAGGKSSISRCPSYYTKNSIDILTTNNWLWPARARVCDIQQNPTSLEPARKINNRNQFIATQYLQQQLP